MDGRRRVDAPPDPEIDGIRRRLGRIRSDAEQRRCRNPIVFRRDLPVATPARPRRLVAGGLVRLEDEVAGVARPCPQGGAAYVIERRFDGSCETWGALCGEFRTHLQDAGSPIRRLIAASCGLDGVRPDDVLFVDLETTGLAGTPLFLIGTMACEGGALVVRQFFARDYSEERPVIAHFAEAAGGRGLLVSFNGKSFDMPYVRVRAAAVGVPFAPDPAHLDLLHVCRRIWRDVLPNCRLQTLERRICGRVRTADIPGSEIPEAYHEYVRTGNALEMLDVLEHNRQDLLTLAELMVRLPPPEAG